MESDLFRTDSTDSWPWQQVTAIKRIFRPIINTGWHAPDSATCGCSSSNGSMFCIIDDNVRISQCLEYIITDLSLTSITWMICKMIRCLDAINVNLYLLRFVNSELGWRLPGVADATALDAPDDFFVIWLGCSLVFFRLLVLPPELTMLPHNHSVFWWGGLCRLKLLQPRIIIIIKP